MARTKKQTKKRTLTAEEVDKALRNYDPDFLACREVHWWKQVGFYYDAEGDIRRLWKCSRCDTTKRNRMSPDGTYVGSTTYKHPDGYRIGHVEKIEVRAESIRRAKIYQNEKTMFAHAASGNGRSRKTYPVHGTRQKVSK